MKQFVQTVDAHFFLENVDTSVSLVGGRKELELLWSPVVEGEMIVSVEYIFPINDFPSVNREKCQETIYANECGGYTQK